MIAAAARVRMTKPNRVFKKKASKIPTMESVTPTAISSFTLGFAVISAGSILASSGAVSGAQSVIILEYNSEVILKTVGKFLNK